MSKCPYLSDESLQQLIEYVDMLQENRNNSITISSAIRNDCDIYENFKRNFQELLDKQLIIPRKPTELGILFDFTISDASYRTVYMYR